MNSLVHSLEGYIVSMFKDILPTYGSIRDWERDKERSLHELVVRGERFLTIDLPAIRKHLERCLDEGLYVSSGLYLCSKTSKKIVVPAFCKDLYLQIFNHDGSLKAEPNVSAIADLRQLYEGFGKLKNPCKQEAIDEEVSNFITNEEELRNSSLGWDQDDLFEDSPSLRSLSFSDCLSHNRGRRESLPNTDIDKIDSVSRSQSTGNGILITLQKVCDLVSSNFGDLHHENDDDYSPERPRHGTGRVSNQKRSESKFDFRVWPRKLDRIFPFDRYGTHDLGLQLHIDDSSRSMINNEHPSKLIAVPKTMSGPRLIGSEPNYHQWIQQLVRNQLESRIRKTPLRYCVSFGNQVPNRELAKSSSASGSHATVDLKSASDRLSTWTIERAFRSNITILERIHASRTRWMKNAINDLFSVIKLKKCFTQGSACTFPVQTIVYSMISIAAVLHSEGSSVSSRSISRAARKVRVFGDDIIVPISSLPNLLEILSCLQLSVNLNKTFSKGKFRESCGLDAYDGIDVTPARIKRFSSNPSHEVAQSMVEASNNFYIRGMWNVSSWIMSHLRKLELPTVRVHDSEGTYSVKGAGYSSFMGYSVGHLKTRWNNDLHRNEVRMDSLTSKSEKVATQSAYDLTEFLFSKSPRYNLLDYLDPPVGGLGIVNNVSSVMKKGWFPLA